MADPASSKNSPPKGMSTEKYARLKAEARNPYRGLRRFIYGSVGASGAIGAFVFLTQLMAGRDVEAALPNFLLQIAVVGLVIGLFRWENRRSLRDQSKDHRKL